MFSKLEHWSTYMFVHLSRLCSKTGSTFPCVSSLSWDRCQAVASRQWSIITCAKPQGCLIRPCSGASALRVGAARAGARDPTLGQAHGSEEEGRGGLSLRLGDGSDWSENRHGRETTGIPNSEVVHYMLLQAAKWRSGSFRSRMTNWLLPNKPLMESVLIIQVELGPDYVHISPPRTNTCNRPLVPHQTKKYAQFHVGFCTRH